MPRLWNDTIEAHRHAVREAVLDAAASLVADHGPLSVTMSAVAERTGVGRATLYKYFPDVASILLAWHERQTSGHLMQLVEIRDRTAPADRLAAVLERYAHLSRHAHGEPGGELAAIVDLGHRRARQGLHGLLTDLVRRASASDAAVRRLVLVTLSGLRPPTSP